MKPTLVVLAAGAGSRYGGLKQLAPIGPGGESLLEYSAFDARRAGFERVVLVVRSETEREFRRRLDIGMARRLPVTYVHQRLDDLPAGLGPSPHRDKPWGTGQAVLAAASEIDGPFAVINADDFYGADSYVVLARFLAEAREGHRLAAVGFPVVETLTDAGPVSRALLEMDDRGRLRRIVEVLGVWREDSRIVYLDGKGHQMTLSGDELVSMNMWGFKPRLLAEMRSRFADFVTQSGGVTGAEFLLPDVIQSVMRDGPFRVEVLPGRGEWCGLTFREDRQRVRSIIASLVDRGRYPEELWA